MAGRDLSLVKMVLNRIVADGTGTVYAVIDGMPMRGREMSGDPDRC